VEKLSVSVLLKAEQIKEIHLFYNFLLALIYLVTDYSPSFENQLNTTIFDLNTKLDGKESAENMNFHQWLSPKPSKYSYISNNDFDLTVEILSGLGFVDFSSSNLKQNFLLDPEEEILFTKFQKGKDNFVPFKEVFWSRVSKLKIIPSVTSFSACLRNEEIQDIFSMIFLNSDEKFELEQFQGSEIFKKILKKRFEFIISEYPPLNQEQKNFAEKLVRFI
jgi:hypothetical protein